MGWPSFPTAEMVLTYIALWMRLHRGWALASSSQGIWVCSGVNSLLRCELRDEVCIHLSFDCRPWPVSNIKLAKYWQPLGLWWVRNSNFNMDTSLIWKFISLILFLLFGKSSSALHSYNWILYFGWVLWRCVSRSCVSLLKLKASYHFSFSCKSIIAQVR